MFFSVDKNRILNLLEGAFIWNLGGSIPSDSFGSARTAEVDEYIGKIVYDVFTFANNGDGQDKIPIFLKPVEDVLTGKVGAHVHEGCIKNRWYRTRFVPVYGKRDPASRDKEPPIDGVIGVSIDVTEIKEKEGSLRAQERENTRLMANEAAAKGSQSIKK